MSAMSARFTWRLLPLFTSLALAVLPACSDDDDAPAPPGDAGPVDASAADAGPPGDAGPRVSC